MATTANNKKPAPAQPPAKNKDHAKPAPAPVSTKADDVDDDLDGDGDSGGGEKSEFHKLPPAKKVAVRLGNEVNRLQKQADTLTKWPTEATGAVQRAKERVTEALDGLKSACEALASLPDDYRPRVAGAGKQGGGKVELLPGSMIRITDKRMPEYEGVLEAEQMRGIKVVEVRGNKVIALTKDGVKAMLARGHVCPDVG